MHVDTRRCSHTAPTNYTAGGGGGATKSRPSPLVFTHHTMSRLLSLSRSLRAPLSPLARAYSAPAMRDPAHPHLYYHPVPQRIALSYLPTPPPSHSSTVLGTLPATEDAGLEDFQENPRFRGVLHAAIKDGLARGVDARIAYEAEMRPGDGYMTLTGGQSSGCG